MRCKINFDNLSHVKSLFAIFSYCANFSGNAFSFGLIQDTPCLLRITASRQLWWWDNIMTEIARWANARRVALWSKTSVQWGEAKEVVKEMKKAESFRGACFDVVWLHMCSIKFPAPQRHLRLMFSTSQRLILISPGLSQRELSIVCKYWQGRS